MAELQYPTPPLADTVVLLRPWRTQDVPGKLMAFGDPLIHQFAWSRTTAYTEADARDYFIEQETARRAGQVAGATYRRPALRSTPAFSCRSQTIPGQPTM